jgi:hypothetical protein
MLKSLWDSTFGDPTFNAAIVATIIRCIADWLQQRKSSRPRRRRKGRREENQ